MRQSGLSAKTDTNHQTRPSTTNTTNGDAARSTAEIIWGDGDNELFLSPPIFRPTCCCSHQQQQPPTPSGLILSLTMSLRKDIKTFRPTIALHCADEAAAAAADKWNTKRAFAKLLS